MKPWQRILLIVPAGVLLGLVAGKANMPVPRITQERPWPESVRENMDTIEPWRPIHEGGLEDLSPARQAYRPDLDYDVAYWPDQEDRSGELLAARYDYSWEEPEVEVGPIERPVAALPQTRRAKAELAAADAVTVVRAAKAAATAAEVPAGEQPGAVTVLPAVPPPLARASVHELSESDEAGTF